MLITAVDAHVAERVRRRRLMVGLTMVQVAANLGVSWQQLKKYERGSDRISASRLYMLARALGVSVDYLFDGVRPDGTVEPPQSEDGWEELEPADARQHEPVGKLVDSYWRINNPTARRRVLDVVRTLAEQPDGPEPTMELNHEHHRSRRRRQRVSRQ